ncbi:MAG: helix-turn-helix transcriptional regulator [Clostridia bacterium]|nr:helix-turn-helix transcriptional regulator [Clostridia bacterium]
MIIFNIKELMEKQNISRYRLQQLTNWNYKRINAYYFNKVININVKELDTLCDIFDCDLTDLIKRKKS